MGAEELKYFERNHGRIKARAGVQERQDLRSAAEVDGWVMKEIEKMLGNNKPEQLPKRFF